MRMVDLIQKKRDGHAHTSDEITWIIQQYTNNTIPDEQMSAWAMAVYFRGMNDQEMADLTLQMAASGDQIDWRDYHLTVADKHSTGGVGDKTTLFVAPWAVACGLKMGKMSGRGLGHTGGTIDKLESIPGFRVDLTPDEFYKQVQEIGLALMGQSKTMTPADAKLYALRDVTGTVPSIPLIASSIMSKKIAAGAQAIVLDVKVGNGAFMKDLDSAIQLAQAMVKIGQSLGRETIALLTNMNQPLGQSVGNILEIKEAIQVLAGKGPKELESLGLELVIALLMAADPDLTSSQAKTLAINALSSGAAMHVFRSWIEAQGGDLTDFDQDDRALYAPIVCELVSDQSGYVSSIDAESVGLCAMRLGAGRAKKSDSIDHRVGIEMMVRVGERVEIGQVLAKIHGNELENIQVEMKNLRVSIGCSEMPCEGIPMVLARVDQHGVILFS